MARHISIKRWWLLVVSIILLLPTLLTIAQSGDDKARIAAVLLTTPDRCGRPCVWTLRPGFDRMSDVRQMIGSLFPTAELQVPDNFILGVYADGIGLYARENIEQGENRHINTLWLRVQPARAQAAGYDISHFTPVAIINALGNPDQAYLLFNNRGMAQTAPERYRLILVYSARRAVYVILGAFRDYQACLTPDTAETLTLYLFMKNARPSGMSPNMWDFMAGNGSLPPTIAETTKQTVADFTRMAQHPDTDCLTLK